jgi:aminoglycoside phosphotransferase (APT) family kinase protein
MTVRLPSAARYAAQVEKEQHWLPMLAPYLPLPIPFPLALGVPGAGYSWPWSVYRWLEGENATIEGIADLRQFATALAEFLLACKPSIRMADRRLERTTFIAVDRWRSTTRRPVKPSAIWAT